MPQNSGVEQIYRLLTIRIASATQAQVRLTQDLSSEQVELHDLPKYHQASKAKTLAARRVCSHATGRPYKESSHQDSESRQDRGVWYSLVRQASIDLDSFMNLHTPWQNSVCMLPGGEG